MGTTKKLTDGQRLTLKKRAESLGAHLRRLRLARGLSMSDLFALSGVSAATISRLEAFRQRHADYQVLWRLADALEVTLDALAGRTPPRR